MGEVVVVVVEAVVAEEPMERLAENN